MPNSLVMGTVDGELRTVEPADKGIRHGVAQVNVIRTRADFHVVFRSWKVLDQRSAQRNVNQLMTAADAEDRFAKVHESAEDTQLQCIQSGIKFGFRSFILSEQGRIDINTSGQQQSVAIFRMNHRTGFRLSAGENQGIDIVPGVCIDLNCG